MFYKTMILFFCVALYYWQCQGAGPNQDQIEKITRIVKDRYNPNGITYEELLGIFGEVNQETGADGILEGRADLEEALERLTFSKDEVVDIARGIVGDNEMKGLVLDLFENNGYKDYINFFCLCLLMHGVRFAKGMDTSTNKFAQMKADLIRIMVPNYDKAAIIDYIIEHF